MRLLVYDPGSFAGIAAAQLREMVEHHNWHADCVCGTTHLRRQLQRPTGGAPSSFREWLLCHEIAVRSRRCRHFAERHYDAFVGFGSFAATLTAVLPRALKKIAIVERSEVDALNNADALETRECDVQQAPMTRTKAIRSFDLRVEVELLQAFDNIFCSANAAEVFRRLAGINPRNFVEVDDPRGDWAAAMARMLCEIASRAS